MDVEDRGVRIVHRTMMATAATTLLLFATGALAQSCPQFEAAMNAGTVQSNDIVEASGLASSRQFPGVLWTHNDSGNTARIYAMTNTGAHLGTYPLSGTSNVDWEDIAVGPAPGLHTDAIWVGDIGDNLNFRSTIRVFRIAEPTVSVNQRPVMQTLSGAQTITLNYPDGPRDAETLMVDTNGDLYIVTKRVTAVGRVYRAAYPQSTSSTIILQFVAQIPWGATDGNGGATGGDIAADGSAIIVRRTTGFNPAATLWLRPPGTNLWDVFSTTGCNLTLTSEPQGEAIAFAPDGLSFYTLSEGSHQPIYFYEVPPVIGDVNGDGTVNVADLLAVIAAWGPCPPPCAADTNGDGAVNISDLLLVIGHWG
jgi:hypothetical protein